jgi:ribosome-binding factor A
MRFSNTRRPNEGGFEPFERAPTRPSARRSAPHAAPRKVHQLCAQVREVIGLSLAERWDDPLIERVSVVSVAPAPDATRLLVLVAVDPGDEPVDVQEVLDALRELRPELRREISSEINRKKTPELAFELAPITDEVPPSLPARP